MKKFVNEIENVLQESLQGFCNAHSELLEYQNDPCFVFRRGGGLQGKVALISGGGSGHEPLHAGLVGQGMLHAACPGEIFTSPTPDQMEAAALKVDGGEGVLFIVKNYSGDVMNFEMASEMINCPNKTIITNDDVAVEDSSFTTGRRGVAGTLIVEKIVGAASEEGSNLESCHKLGVEVNSRTRSMGVALTSCTVPAVGKPTFDIGNTEMEMGVGIHGEPGRKRVSIESANSIAEEMTNTVMEDLNSDPKDPVLLFINGFGATPIMELYLMYNCVHKLLTQKGYRVLRSLVGNYVTSLDMNGCSITVSSLNTEMIRLWDAPVNTAALRWKC